MLSNRELQRDVYFQWAPLAGEELDKERLEVRR